MRTSERRFTLKERRVRIVKFYYETKNAAEVVRRFKRDCPVNDIFVWGIVKEIVYANKSNNLDEMTEAYGTHLNTLMQVIFARKSAALLLRAVISVSLQMVAISRT